MTTKNLTSFGQASLWRVATHPIVRHHRSAVRFGPEADVYTIRPGSRYPSGRQLGATEGEVSHRPRSGPCPIAWYRFQSAR
jgi:hypothetical protein